ncbi:MAG: hypothetical protein NUV48_14070 [Peptococcaceae bacterium]|jgi:hypothetical protein|nr:hypothetical protein [Peptococcaceae bacterium]
MPKKLVVWFCLIAFVFLVCSAFAGPVLAQNESNFIKKDSQGLPVIDTGSGLPTVTEDQVVKKAYRVVGSFYNMVAQIAPHITLGVVIIAAIAGIIFESARTTIKWAVIGLVLVLWGPQIVAFIVNMLSA